MAYRSFPFRKIPIGGFLMAHSQTILITGATSGIGRGLALRLAAAGHRVFATGRGQTALDALQMEAAVKGLRLETVILDVTNSASIDAARDDVDRRTSSKGPDVLINNAGYALYGPLEVLKKEDIQAQFETNVFGLLAVTRAFIPHMRERHAGRIINISSVMGRVSFPYTGAYNATKYSVECFSDTLRSELAPFDIQVVIIEPSTTRSGFWKRDTVALSKYATVDSPYAESLGITERYLRSLETRGVEPERVVRVVELAVEAIHPKARYLVSFKDRLFLMLFTWLPTRVVDGMKRKAFGLKERPGSVLSDESRAKPANSSSLR
jgi:NAD(P)-dependent dehydrogenase (short-subunit alcohol dehydrogenase family)